ncbi:hypothetical protein DSUL_30077 [Desulfovibrionales bacterium]
MWTSILALERIGMAGLRKQLTLFFYPKIRIYKYLSHKY